MASNTLSKAEIAAVVAQVVERHQAPQALIQAGQHHRFGAAAGRQGRGRAADCSALDRGQALQQAKAGIEAVYLWLAGRGRRYPGLQHVSRSVSLPGKLRASVVDRINNTFRRADQIQWAAGIEPNDPRFTDYFLPIVADEGQLVPDAFGARRYLAVRRSPHSAP